MKKTGILILAAFLSALGACDIFMQPVSPGGNLTVTTGSGARSVSDDEVRSFRYEFDFTGPRGESFTRTLSPGEESVNLSVSLGEWTINARAYKAFADGEILVGTGSITYTVTPGKNSVLVLMDLSGDYTVKEITAFTLAEVSGTIS
uniref:hypothetical protein n=1 Tax=Treponema primitia TaxID=88058 RepID=UPI000255545E